LLEAVPDGNGYGTLIVSKTGAARFVGKLGDGTAISYGGPVSVSGRWPIHALLDRRRGAIFGDLFFRDTANSDLDGTLKWVNASDAAKQMLVEIPVHGSRYNKPSRGEAWLTPPDFWVTIGGGNLASPVAPQLLSLPEIGKSNSLTVVGEDRLTIKFDLKSGLFSGMFTNPETRAPQNFSGAVLLKMGTGYGVFTGKKAGVGFVDLQPQR